MGADELLLDPAIRDWVLVPIVVVMLFVGIFRHNITVLMKGEKKPGSAQSVADSQALMKSSLLRLHGEYIPRRSFYARKEFFNHPDRGFFKQDKRSSPANMMSDPSMMMDMMKGNVSMVIPQMLIMGTSGEPFRFDVLVLGAGMGRAMKTRP